MCLLVTVYICKTLLNLNQKDTPEAELLLLRSPYSNAGRLFVPTGGFRPITRVITFVSSSLSFLIKMDGFFILGRHRLNVCSGFAYRGRV